MKYIYLLGFIAAVSFAQPQHVSPEHFARDRSYHVVHYKLSLDLDEKAKICIGDATIKLVPLRTSFDTLLLDAGEMKIQKVIMDKHALNFQLTGETLAVALGKPYGLRDTVSVSISYELSSPKKGMYFITPDSGYPKKQWQIWTQGENLDNHFWFPCYDFPNDKATSEMIVTVNDRFTAIGNGKLLDVQRDTKKHKATYHWYENKPHSSYLISLVVGEYVELKDKWGKLPISNYVYKHDKDIGMISFSKTPKMIDFFSKKIGYDYPWEKFAQSVVQDFIFGGMENVSAVTLTDFTIHDARAHLSESSDGLVAHELAHQWWGDLLTCRDWSHAWLNEGFATYFEVLFQEYDKGRDWADKELYDTQQSLVMTDVGEHRRPTVWNRYDNPIELFDNHIYGKGACVLHMMRFILGDELFWKAINHYAHKFAFQNVETNDLKVAVEEATGYNLRWFFDQWLYKAGYPEFEMHTSWNETTKTVHVAITQLQENDSLTGLFITPVDIAIWVNNEQSIHRVMITKSPEEFQFPASQKPQLVLFDKGNWLLKKVYTDRPMDEWIFQLQHAQDAVDRMAAIREIRNFGDTTVTANALTKAMLHDSFWGVRQNAVMSLQGMPKSCNVDSLLLASRDKEARVRASAMGTLRNYYNNENVIHTLLNAFEHDSSYSVASSALTSLTTLDTANVKKYCKMGLERNSHHEIIRSVALRALATIGDEEALSIVKSYTKYGNEQNLRRDCLSLLGRVWKKREDVVDYLISMLHDPSFSTRRSVISILGDVGNKKAVEPLEKNATSEPDSRLAKAARESIEKIQQAQK